MPVTLNGIDIETVNDIVPTLKPKINTLPLGVHALLLTPQLQNMLHQYHVSGAWTAGDSDYDSKESKIQNMVMGGLPVWFDATSWRKNYNIFGRIHELQTKPRGSHLVEFDFLITGVFPWGYIFLQDGGAGDLVIYDLDRLVQAISIYPILNKCNFTKGASSVTFSIYVKNTHATLARTCILELMVPDEINSGNVSSKITATALWSKAAGTLGTTGFSTSPGTKQRVTLTKAISANTEEQLDITINYVSSKTSFIDGSINDIAP